MSFIKKIKTMTNKIIIIDLEATCWEGIPPKGEVSEIIEIGICCLIPLQVRLAITEVFW